MKSFKIKYDRKYYPNESQEKQRLRYRKNAERHEREFRKLYKKAFDYIFDQIHYKDAEGKQRVGQFRCFSEYSIWVRDDREWCKQCEEETGKDYAIFEVSIEIAVLTVGEAQVLSTMGQYRVSKVDDLINIIKRNDPYEER